MDNEPIDSDPEGSGRDRKIDPRQSIFRLMERWGARERLRFDPHDVGIFGESGKLYWLLKPNLAPNESSHDETDRPRPAWVCAVKMARIFVEQWNWFFDRLAVCSDRGGDT